MPEISNIASTRPLAALAMTLAFIFFADARPLFPAEYKTTVSGPEHRTELWEGKVLGATFRAGMCFTPRGAAKGVLLLRHANGNEDAYHLYGRINRDEFDLTHSSGHFFSGKITGPDSMEGKARLKNGLRLTLKGKRATDVPLMAEDCAPLPQ